MRLTQSGTKMKTLKTDGSDLQTAGIGLRIRGVPECGRIRVLQDVGVRTNTFAAGMVSDGRTDAGGK